MVNKFLSTNIYTGFIGADKENVYPSPIRGTYPASGSGPATLNWPTDLALKPNWIVENVVAGSLGDLNHYAVMPGSPYKTLLK